MPRQKLSEYRAKTIISVALDLPYQGWSIDAEVPLAKQLTGLAAADEPFVVKVDEGVKGRFKKGLVMLDVSAKGVHEAITDLSNKGYRWLLVEPLVKHESPDERYIVLTGDREGLLLQYTAQGGVDVEAHAEDIKQVRIDDATDWGKLAAATAISEENLRQLVNVFEANYFTFMEINPYVVNQAGLRLLDAAVEVDDAASFFADNWHSDDFRRHTTRAMTPEEQSIIELDDKSPASFKLDVLEPNGSIFLLLSGGGASVLVADEIYNQGYGRQLANYGEYSGNPNTEETYLYTKAVLQLLIQSSAKRKVVFIGGAVANFTDVAKTFAGVIQALEEVADKLKAQQVKFFVRRGGPNQEAGLEHIEAVLAKHQLLGAVHSPKTTLTDAVKEALQEIGHD
jgi:ATP-citrate lyase beta-subunit